jgi:hypothetical protein
MWLTTDKFGIRIEPSEEWGKVIVRAHSRKCIEVFLGEAGAEIYGIEQRPKKGDLRYSTVLPRGEVLQAVRNWLDTIGPNQYIKVDPFKALDLDDPDVRYLAFGE